MNDLTLVALARYNRWANERVLEQVSRLDVAARSEPAPGTAGSLAHLADTEVHFTGLVRGETVDAVEATGFRAVAEVVSRFPGRYLAWSVGTRFDFEAPTA